MHEAVGKLIQGTNAATDVGKVMDAARKLVCEERELGKPNLD
jgi:hypothetical protein